MLPAYFFFQVFNGIVRNVLFIGGNKFYIITHAFNIENVIVIKTDQFSIGLNKNIIGIGFRYSILGSCGCVRYFSQCFLETLVSKRLFQEISHVVFKSII